MIASDQISKIICFEDDAQRIDPVLIDDPPHLCFIDGEHTASAVQADFNFCMSICRSDAVICFHDAQLIYAGIEAICQQLKRDRVTFSATMLSGSVFAIALGDAAVLNVPCVSNLTHNPQIFILGARLSMFYKHYLNGVGKSFIRPVMQPLLRLAGLQGVINRTH